MGNSAGGGICRSLTLTRSCVLLLIGQRCILARRESAPVCSGIGFLTLESQYHGLFSAPRWPLVAALM